MKHYSVGLEKRDRVNHAVGGGFPEGSVVLVEGPTGAGKSVLVQRFTYGLAEEDTRVGVASTGLSADDYVQQMHSLSYDVVRHLLSGRVRYFHARVDGDRRLVRRLLRPSPLWRGEVVVVDGFGALVRNDPDFGDLLGTGEEDRAVERVGGRLRQATDAGKVVVLTVDPAAVTDRAMRPLRSLSDVYLELVSETVGQEIRRKALVRRFAGMKEPVDDSIGFAVQQGRGVVIESRTIA